MNRPLIAILVSVSIGLAGGILGGSPLGLVLEESVGLRALFRARGPVEPPADVVVVALDRRSADELGLAADPREWPRSLHGKLVDRLAEARAALIVFDLAFVKPRPIEEDMAFAQAISRSGRVILFASMRKELQPAAGRPQPSLGGGVWRERLQRPLPQLAEPALAVAPFPLPKASTAVSQFWSFSPDVDNKPTLPTVALQALEVETWLQVVQEAGLLVLGQSFLDQLHPAVAQDLDEVPGLLRRTFEQVPALADEVRRVIDERRHAGLSDEREWRLLHAFADLYSGPDSYYLNLYGPPGTIRTIPYHRALAAVSSRGQDLHDLAGAVIFVGYSERDTISKADAFPTVFTRNGVDISGVEIAATAFANLLTGSMLRPADPLTAALVLLAFGASVGAISCLMPATFAVPAALSLAVAYSLLAYVLFSRTAAWVPVAIPLLGQVPVALITGTLLQYVLTRRQRNRARDALGSYVPALVARDLADRPQRVLMARGSQYAACLAARAENFAALAEAMPPEAASSYLNQYFDVLAEAMHGHRADIMRFHIDGVLYAWTSDRADVGVREQACLAAVAAAEAVDAFNVRCAPLSLDFRVGLHAGPLPTGEAAGSAAFDSLGAVAEMAARIERLGTELGTRLLATDAAAADLEDLLLRPLGTFVIQGRKAPVSVVEIVTLKDRASMAQLSLCGRFAGALEALRAQQRGEAALQFEAILAAHPDDGPSRFYLRTCRSRRRAASTPVD